MRWLLGVVALLSVQAAPAAEFAAVLYHDITPAADADRFAVTTKAFTDQMTYLRSHGYTPVSLALLERVRRGEAELPDKPVLLTFDDGLRSYATRALPVLERFGYPSVLSVMTSWADGNDVPPEYRGKVMSWDEIRRVARSPLVEIVSHTDNLHHGVRINSEGNEASASIARLYDPATGARETEDGFRARIRADLARSQKRLTQELGHPVIGIAWPFGDYDAVLVEEATRLGMRYQLTLDNRATSTENLPRINRAVLRHYRGLSDFANIVSLRQLREAQLRFVEIDLRPFAHRSAVEREKLLSVLLDRLELLRVNAVILSPFSADGTQAFFANGSLPVAADVLNRVLYQLRTRTAVRQNVYLRIPPLPAVKDASGLFTDLSRGNPFGGVIFDDPAMSGDPGLLRVLRYYHPGIRVGANGEAATRSDFLFVEIDARAGTGAIERDVQRFGRERGSAWFLMRCSPGVGAGELQDALKTLREAGARNYGYGDDDFIAGVPDVLKIVGELNGHTIAGGAP